MISMNLIQCYNDVSVNCQRIRIAVEQFVDWPLPPTGPDEPLEAQNVSGVRPLED